MRQINKIIVHCSYSEWGDVDEIRRWHTKQNGWTDIGYHFVICNAYPTHPSFKYGRPVPEMDGQIQEGRPIENPGAHVKGYNNDSIGICLIGKKVFTLPQITFLARKIDELQEQFGDLSIHGHYEFDKSRTCPNLDIDYLVKRHYI